MVNKKKRTGNGGHCFFNHYHSDILMAALINDFFCIFCVFNLYLPFPCWFRIRKKNSVSVGVCDIICILSERAVRGQSGRTRILQRWVPVWEEAPAEE